ncbi:RNA 2',3'-cyclic phosphodiesterase [Phorcysia thermohydrogeniphila]|uniref:RNA 2',3'-cyclic phosphodiesterase n=1 Tax=Phorcysia thermohydrogeniphila TaxID=936138 RepID=A0A4R1GCL4_9BACT|nr:RNA 2',3'-cyclic phosphodiesterase [Phorcysia thermohydrogeniphila]TCK04533.1 2'-5' RNA ligase [Phorcysia thermohydrogeniphila]
MPKKRLFIGTLTFVSGLEAVREVIDSLGITGKWVERENIHFTYRFLGDVDEEKIPSIASMLKGKLRGVRAPLVEYKGLGVFPSLRSPRVLWVGMNSEALYEVKRKVDMALLPFGFPLEERFTPHLTLLRIKKLRHQTKFKNYLFKMREHLFERKLEAKVCLIESKLTPQGPIYSVLEEILLD